ncbi:hypothetical protein, partial [Flavonifractor sp. An52]|uniref:hypothetical protein n=1 Tax=Flavonifractor sp. An52 TaxID=1965642 RepID=UPI00194E5837
CGRQTTSTLSGSFFFFYSSPRFKLFFTPGLAGGCLWYHQTEARRSFTAAGPARSLQKILHILLEILHPDW